MLAAIFRVVLKAYGERARCVTLPGHGFRQVGVDADFLRQVLGRLCPLLYFLLWHMAPLVYHGVFNV